MTERSRMVHSGWRTLTWKACSPRRSLLRPAVATQVPCAVRIVPEFAIIRRVPKQPVFVVVGIYEGKHEYHGAERRQQAT